MAESTFQVGDGKTDLIGRDTDFPGNADFYDARQQTWREGITAQACVIIHQCYRELVYQMRLETAQEDYYE